MGLIALYWGSMFVCYFIASRMRNIIKGTGTVDKVMNIAIYICVLIMGLRMGANEEVIDSLGSIGIQALIITVLAITLSMMAVTLTRKILGMDRFGNIKSADKPDDLCSEKVKQGAVCNDTSGEGSMAFEKKTKEGCRKGDVSKSLGNNAANLKTTLIIVLMVAGGMAVGYFVILKGLGTAENFLYISDKFLVFLIALLLALVGFSMGITGNVVKNLKRAGFRVLFFPFAAVGGTVLAGVLYGLFSPLTVGEAVAVVSGFGWYTYAPNVISQAGHQVAAAICFLSNVLRETTGIIGIPFIASKIGYIEATAVPGVAAMDICIPIVERSAGEDTIVYSFAIGAVMALSVPLIVGAAV